MTELVLAQRKAKAKFHYAIQLASWSQNC